MSIDYDLSSLGFIKKGIVETIVSTYGADGLPTAAPMGIITRDMKSLIIRPYTTSSTYRNLLLRRCAVVNLSTDPTMFYKTAFKDANPDNRVPAEWFEKIDGIDAPKLRDADACIMVKVTSIGKSRDGRARMVGKVEGVDAKRLTPRAYCRASFAVIESIIHATRIKVFMRKERERAKKLIELVEYYSELVDRVVPGSTYVATMRELLSRIDRWRADADEGPN